MRTGAVGSQRCTRHGDRGHLARACRGFPHGRRATHSPCVSSNAERSRGKTRLVARADPPHVSPCQRDPHTHEPASYLIARAHTIHQQPHTSSAGHIENASGHCKRNVGPLRSEAAGNVLIGCECACGASDALRTYSNCGGDDPPSVSRLSCVAAVVAAGSKGPAGAAARAPMRYPSTVRSGIADVAAWSYPPRHRSHAFRKIHATA